MNPDLEQWQKRKQLEQLKHADGGGGVEGGGGVGCGSNVSWFALNYVKAI
jgi:hypothetical protein